MSAIREFPVGKNCPGIATIFQCLKSRSQFVVIAPDAEALKNILLYRCGYEESEIDPGKFRPAKLQPLTNPATPGAGGGAP